MKGAGWLGIVGIAGGVLMIYSGYTGAPLLDVVRAILRGEPVPTGRPADAGAILPATQGSSSGSGFDLTPLEPIGAGSGGGGGGGGGW